MNRMLLLTASLTLVLYAGLASANHHKGNAEKQGQMLEKRCGDDQACRDKLKAKMLENKKNMKKKCGDNKDCMKKIRHGNKEVQELKTQYAKRKKSECGEDKKCQWKLQKEFKKKSKELKSKN